MKNILKVDHKNKQLIMYRTFAKRAEIVGSYEYNQLQQARRDYPDYTVVQRHIKKNPNQERYKGLTYTYMRNYIRGHEAREMVNNVIAEFDEQLLIAACHSRSRRYPAVKSWFLERYPEIAEFGLTAQEAITVDEPIAFPQVRELENVS